MLNHGQSILLWEDLQQVVPLSRSTIWRLEARGKFPKRVSIGGRRVGWLATEVQDWIANRAEHRAHVVHKVGEQDD